MTAFATASRHHRNSVPHTAVCTSVNGGDPGFGVYIHWPFCHSKCPYCDFNSHVAAAVEQRRWRAALIAELEHFADEVPGRTVTSMFFGGGTPSLMEPETVAALIDSARRLWTTVDNVEITLEANPSGAEAERFRAFRAAGINRLSVGVQSLDDARLAFLGRGHSAAEAESAVAVAADHFSRYSCDLIYGLPGQTAADWRRELVRAAAMAGGHMSCYQLTIEPGTPFHRQGVKPAPEDTGAALYRATQEVLQAAGLPAYEISNHARPGDECRHNLTYWRGGEYVGIGPGAHGRLRRDGATLALYQLYAPDRWLSAVERDGHATAKRRVLTRAARVREIVLMGLRLERGIDGGTFRRAAGVDLADALDGSRLQPLVDSGLLSWDGHCLRASSDGRLRLDAVLRFLLGRADPAFN